MKFATEGQGMQSTESERLTSAYFLQLRALQLCEGGSCPKLGNPGSARNVLWLQNRKPHNGIWTGALRLARGLFGRAHAFQRHLNLRQPTNVMPPTGRVVFEDVRCSVGVFVLPLRHWLFQGSQWRPSHQCRDFEHSVISASSRFEARVERFARP